MKVKKYGQWLRRAGVPLTAFLYLTLCACGTEGEGDAAPAGGNMTAAENIGAAGGSSRAKENEIASNASDSEKDAGPDKASDSEKDAGPDKTSDSCPAVIPVLSDSPQKTPEEILGEQLINENHDTFLVEKAGKTGTVLVTAERQEGYTLVEFSVWDLENMEKPIQVTEPTSGFNEFGKHMVVDANFDGWMDFGYVKSIHDGREYWEFWFWNEEKSQFEKGWFGFCFLNPVFSADTKTLCCLDEKNGSGSFYHWENDRFCKIRSITTTYEDDKAYFTVTDNFDDVFVRVFSRSYEKDSPEWQEQWELWCDLDYHGEPGSAGDLLRSGIPEGTIYAFVMNAGSDAKEILVTAQPCGEGDEPDTLGTQYRGDGKIKFSVWNPADMSEPMQSMCKYVEQYQYQGSHIEQYEVIDANFDGYMDFAWICHTGNQPVFYYLWLWDEKQKRFVEEPAYNEISTPVADAEKEIIYGWSRSSVSGTGVSTIHKWIDGHLLCLRNIEVWRSSDSDNYTMTVEDRVNGEMTEVYRAEFLLSGAFDAEREKWNNLDYHGDE